MKGEVSYDLFKSSLAIRISPAKPLIFSRISVLNPFTIPTARIITAKPSVIPRIAIRTINLEKLRSDLNVMRLAIKRDRFKG